MSYLLSEGIISSAAFYVIIKKIMTPFEEWDAYKLGIIDKDGNKLRTPITAKERDSWDILSKFTCNFKKLVIKFIGKSNFATWFTVAYLLKDSIDYFYIKHNIQKLDENYLNDFTIKKQNYIFHMIKNAEENFGKEIITEENFSLLFLKYYDFFKKTVDIEELL